MTIPERRSPSGAFISGAAYLQAGWSAPQIINAATTNLLPNVTVRSRGGILLNPATGVFTLPALLQSSIDAGVYYELVAQLFMGFGTSPPGEASFGWVDSANVLLPGVLSGTQIAANTDEILAPSNPSYISLAPSVPLEVHLRTQTGEGFPILVANDFSYIVIREVQ